MAFMGAGSATTAYQDFTWDGSAIRLWRLYGKHAHARATNFYEVDLPEALTASGDKGEMDHHQWAASQTYPAHKDLVQGLFDLKVLAPAMGSNIARTDPSALGSKV